VSGSARAAVVLVFLGVDALSRTADVRASARHSARAAVRAIGLQIETLVDLAIAVVVDAVAALRDWGLRHAGELRALALKRPAAARALVARHGARRIAIHHVVRDAVAVVVRAVVPASLGLRHDGTLARAEHSIHARLHSGFALADVQRVVRCRVASAHLALVAAANLVAATVAVFID
jgi:hypothetical protein